MKLFVSLAFAACSALEFKMDGDDALPWTGWALAVGAQLGCSANVRSDGHLSERANGWLDKHSAADATCETSVRSCKATECCETNPSTCAGRWDEITCPDGEFKTRSNKRVDSSLPYNEQCCFKKTTCKDYKCPGFSTAKVSAADTVCTEQTITERPSRNFFAEGCTTSECCEFNERMCGGAHLSFQGQPGVEVTCPEGKFKDSSKDLDSWTSKTDKRDGCCTTKPKCSDYTCPTGYTAKVSEADTSCTFFPGAAGSGTCSVEMKTCCQAEGEGVLTSCRMSDVECPEGKFKDPSKNGVEVGTTDTDKQKNCCTAKATCSEFTSQYRDHPDYQPLSIMFTSTSTSTSTGTSTSGGLLQNGNKLTCNSLLGCNILLQFMVGGYTIESFDAQAKAQLIKSLAEKLAGVDEAAVELTIAAVLATAAKATRRLTEDGIMVTAKITYPTKIAADEANDYVSGSADDFFAKLFLEFKENIVKAGGQVPAGASISEFKVNVEPTTAFSAASTENMAMAASVLSAIALVAVSTF